MRVGVIGCGSIGKVHIRNLKRIGAEVIAACDIDEKELKYVKSEFGIENLYTDYHDLIARDDLDAVVVATPNYLHHEMTINALKEGKHVLCEKPPALTARQVKEMYEASRKYGRALLIGLTMRFRADSRALKEYVEKVGIGEPYYAKAGILRRTGIPGYGSWFTRKAEAGAGPLYDIGVHALDLTLWLMGDFEAEEAYASIYAKFGPKGKGLGDWGKPVPGGPFEVEDLAVAFIKMKSGATVYLEVSWAGHLRGDLVYVNILGDEGGLEFPGAKVYCEENGVTVDKQLRYREEDPYIVEMRHFKEVVERGVEPVTKPSEMINLQAILEAALRSATEGRPIKISDVI
ncbi:MAG: gfo/Idh/MocA family oxidoreductase [Thermoprotei archaeon]|nr:MAG: gfo/Idh/MocA family oxidoreductase [Thermoprotei archaeon]